MLKLISKRIKVSYFTKEDVEKLPDILDEARQRCVKVGSVYVAPFMSSQHHKDMMKVVIADYYGSRTLENDYRVSDYIKMLLISQGSPLKDYESIQYAEKGIEGKGFYYISSIKPRLNFD